ncbi:adenylate/guanylate cyclase domain-containing protein [Alteraurantiacibacter aestuarii]|nr:adenylate/guanylate cyclase domain-containing protein [Alteraurantiacibacter aestuarii]
MAAFLARLEKFGPQLAGFSALALVVLLQLADSAPLQRVRMQIFDAFQVLAPNQDSAPQGVAVVDIDEEAIAQLGQWPWPRTELAQLTRRLGEAGAAVVAYDIVFSEADRTSPANIAARYEQLGRGTALSEALAGLPSNDALFAESFSTVPVVTGFFLEAAQRGRDIEPVASFTLHGSLPTAHVRSYAGSLQPLPVLEQAAAGNGSLSLDNDADGIVRRVPLVAIHRGVLVPSLSLEAVRVARDAGSPNLVASDGSGENASAPGAAVSVRLDGIEIPVNDAGEMWVHYPEPGQRKMIPAGPIISGALSDQDLAREVAGKIVFVGGSAVGLQDLVSTPLSERIAGVTVHAAAAEQILSGHFLERPDWAIGLERVLVVLLGAGLALLLPRLGAALGALAAMAGMAAVAAGSWFAFTSANYLLDPTYPVLALVVIYGVQTVMVFYREERQRSYIHAAFDRFLSPEMVRQIAADPSKLELGGEERDMSVLMCDIRGFSSISERYSPRQVIDFLIDFLTPMSDILLAHRATLDKYIGDAILAFWNAPLDDPDHHRNAARAALAMIAATNELNRTMPGREGAVWPGEVKIGIGLNSGLCCVGNMGSRQRLSYSLIGDTVNVAARLEGLTKQYGVPIIAGNALVQKLDGFAVFEIDNVRVVGRAAPAKLFALLGDADLLADERFIRLARAHAAMLAAYRAQQWDAAETALAGGLADYQALCVPGLHSLFARRIAALRAAPPGEGWDGVFQATEK